MRKVLCERLLLQQSSAMKQRHRPQDGSVKPGDICCGSKVKMAANSQDHYHGFQLILYSQFGTT
jgi:hypothetical protein